MAANDPPVAPQAASVAMILKKNRLSIEDKFSPYPDYPNTRAVWDMAGGRVK
ncbi:hypothetical protein [Desulfomonile tiedjei]|uniref:hypothetical protein n=1 Tax=Desulfomonile tiedjei TaxID=2358 RepID=UPI0002E91297|nr:hypothetical protein [Desulfomonile tiedjei]